MEPAQTNQDNLGPLGAARIGCSNEPQIIFVGSDLLGLYVGRLPLSRSLGHGVLGSLRAVSATERLR